MDVSVKIKEEGKDHYSLTVNGCWLGIWERSELRHLMQTIDNGISPWMRRKEEPQMSAEEFSQMIAASREAALAEGDEDGCIMCSG